MKSGRLVQCAFALAAIGAASAVIHLYTRATSPADPLPPTDDRQAASPEVPTPPVPFTDVTETAGIRFRHFNGATGWKLLPETMGGGVAVLDYDQDGKPDLLFINSREWPGHAPPPGGT